MRFSKSTILLLVLAVMLTSASLHAAQPVFLKVLDYQVPQTIEPNDTGIFSLAVGDLNRDGKKDIYAGAERPFGISSPNFFLRQGATGREMFTIGMQENGGAPQRKYIGDWNGDSWNDALWARNTYYEDEDIPFSSGCFWAYRSLGINFNWSPTGWEYDADSTNIGGPFNTTKPADLNQDGKPDLLTIRNKDGQVYLRSNDGAGHFNVTTLLGYFNYTAAETGDFNDIHEIYPMAIGHLDATSLAAQNDIVIARPRTGELFIWFPNPVGIFNNDANYISKPSVYGGYETHSEDLHLRVTHLAIGDFDGDNKNDIVVAREDGSLYINLQRPALQGTFVPDFSNNPLIMNYGKKLIDMKVGDVDGDGRADIVAARSDGILSVNYQKTPGVFNYQVLDRIPADVNDANGMITSVDIGDMDNDGINDITVGVKDGRILTYYGICSAMLVGDLTGDCMVDFRDVQQFVSQWLGGTLIAEMPYLPEDLSGDGIVNFKDFADLAYDWMRCNLVNQSNCWN